MRVFAEVLVQALSVAVVSPVLAQQSASYRLTEHVVNAGGRPANGVVATSASFRIKLDAIGDAVTRTGLSSASFRSDVGFASAYPPPGEVTELVAPGKQTLAWRAERSGGRYDLYRGAINSLPGLGYGDCFQQEIGGTTTTDAETAAASNGWFYLVTAENRLEEEGTKGWSTAAERAGTVCP